MYYDGTNVIIYGFSNGGSYNTVFSPVSSISWTWANIGNGSNVISMAYNGTVYVICNSSSPYWYKSTSLTGSWTNFTNGQTYGQNYGCCCTDSNTSGSILCCGGSGQTAFYGSGNMSSITNVAHNPSVGVQVCFHSSILNKWFIADMSNTTSTCYLSQNLQGDFNSWNNGGTGVGTFYYTQQYSQKMITFFILLSLELPTWFVNILLSILQVQHTIPQR